MKLRTYTALGLLALGATGCDGLLDTEPKQSVTPDVVLGTVGAYRNLLASAYNRLQSQNLYGQRLMVAPTILADEANLDPSPSGRFIAEEVNSIGSGVGTGTWATWYALINDINFVLTGIDGVTGVEATKNQIKAEALFLRALAYHNLARTFSYEPGREINGFNLGVVIRTEPTREPGQAIAKPRATNVETYAQIETDLNASIALFTQNNSRNVFLANLAAAQALMARVSLYQSKWAQAESFATAALTASGTSANTSAAALTTAATHVASWEREPTAHPESFFELAVNAATETLGINEALASVYTNVGAGAHWDVVPSVEFMALFPAGTTDVRLSLYPTGTATSTTRKTVKFNATAGNFTDNIPVIRYAEVLLIRAEARAEQGNLAGALADLNQLRTARGLTAAPAFASQAEAITALLTERRRELAFEGHRWFDLKRRNLPLTKPAKTGIGTIQPNDFRWLDDLPADQVQLSRPTGGTAVLVQNPGY